MSSVIEWPPKASDPFLEDVLHAVGVRGVRALVNYDEMNNPSS